MRQTLAFWISFAALAVSPSLGTERVRRPRAQDVDGREVLVRMYNNWGQNHFEYKELRAKLRRTQIELDSDDIAESSRIVVLGEDQSDEAVRRYMGESICAEAYKHGIRLRIPQGRGHPYAVNFKDAVGRPLSGAILQVFLYGQEFGADSMVLVSEVKLDAQARFLAPFISGALNRLYFIVSHPDNYGTVMVDSSRLKPRRSVEKSVSIPWVAGDTIEHKGSLCGVVVDDTNSPIAGASVVCSAVTLPDETTLRTSARVLADDKGWFHLYPCLSGKNGGKPIPPQSEYEVFVECPAERNLAPFAGNLRCDTDCAMVRLADHGYFHTFVFEGREGPITDQDGLNGILIEIRRPGMPALVYKYSHVRSGRYLPPGTYSAYADWAGQRYEFKPLEVTENTGEKLVFTFSKETVYFGRVVHGITGEPMAGAFVIHSDVSNFISGANLSQVRPEQWELFHQLPASPSMQDPNLRLLRTETCTDELMRSGLNLQDATRLCYSSFNMEQIVRTDKDGRFEMAYKPGTNMRSVIVFEEDYLGICRYVEGLETTPDGRLKIPVIPLFPAAKVRIALSAEGSAHLSVVPLWAIDTNDLPDWAGKPWQSELREQSLLLDEFHTRDANGPSPSDDVYPYGRPHPGMIWLYMLYDLLMTERYSLFGIPVVVNRPYYYRAGSESAETDLAGNSALLDKQVEAVMEDPNRIPSFIELYEGIGEFTYGRIIPAQGVQTFHVPAGINVGLKLIVLDNADNRWECPVIPETINLADGKCLDLGSYTIRRSLQVFVNVVNSADEPVQGAPVRNHFGDREWGWPCATTGEDGRVSFNVARHSKGKFYVSPQCGQQDKQDSLSYEIGGDEDNAREFLLTLSDEVLQELSK